MTRYDVLIAVIYMISFIIANNKRAKNWIIAGAASYVVSMAYQILGFKFYSIFSIVCDSFICFLINFYGKYLWEKILWQLWKISVFVSALYIYGIIYNEFYHEFLIECVNWISVGWIFGLIFFERQVLSCQGNGLKYLLLTRARRIYTQKACFPHWWMG